MFFPGSVPISCPWNILKKRGRRNMNQKAGRQKKRDRRRFLCQMRLPVPEYRKRCRYNLPMQKGSLPLSRGNRQNFRQRRSSRAGKESLHL